MWKVVNLVFLLTTCENSEHSGGTCLINELHFLGYFHSWYIGAVMQPGRRVCVPDRGRLLNNHSVDIDSAVYSVLLGSAARLLLAADVIRRKNAFRHANVHAMVADYNASYFALPFHLFSTIWVDTIYLFVYALLFWYR